MFDYINHNAIEYIHFMWQLGLCVFHAEAHISFAITDYSVLQICRTCLAENWCHTVAGFIWDTLAEIMSVLLKNVSTWFGLVRYGVIYLYSGESRGMGSEVTRKMSCVDIFNAGHNVSWLRKALENIVTRWNLKTGQSRWPPKFSIMAAGGLTLIGRFMFGRSYLK